MVTPKNLGSFIIPVILFKWSLSHYKVIAFYSLKMIKTKYESGFFPTIYFSLAPQLDTRPHPPLISLYYLFLIVISLFYLVDPFRLLIFYTLFFSHILHIR